LLDAADFMEQVIGVVLAPGEGEVGFQGDL
jgi:hypothetical protein